MARPVMIRTKSNVAVFVAAFVVIAERVTSSFSGFLVEPAAWENATSSFYPHHRCAGPGVLDGRVTFEAGLAPVVNIALAGDVVGSHAIVRQADDGLTP